jgi:hypothetical protein
MPVSTSPSLDRTFPITPAKRPLLRLTRGDTGQFLWLRNGKQGSLQTAYQMARLVREDTVRDEGLQRFAAQILINNGLDSHSDKRAIVDTLYRYVQQQIKYIHDPAGAFDSVSSARETIAKGFGDCDDKAVLLATLLALVGQEPRFVLAKYRERSKGFDHIYNDIVLPNGERLALDTCSGNSAGWESSRYFERLTYPIFAFPTTSLGEAMQLATTGISAGLSFIPGAGPILSSLVGPIASLFSRKQQRAEEAARDEYKDQVLRGMEKIETAVKSCQITREQGIAAARELVAEFYKACDQFTKKSVASSCRNFESQDFPGGAQEGAIKTHQARIEAAGSSCALTKGQSGALSVSGMSGGSQFPIWLLVVGGVGLFLMLRR